MFEADFSKMLREHPECLGDRRVFTSYMKDLFPGQKMMTNVLTSLLEQDIVAEIQTADVLNAPFSFRFVKKVMDAYGIGEDNATEGVYLWCKCYGKDTLGKPFEIQSKKTGSQPVKQEKKGLYQDHFTFRPIGGRNAVTGCNDKYAKTLVVPNEINGTKLTMVAQGAFSDMTNIEQAVLTEGYTEIGKEAFSGCVSLKQMILPYGVQTIDERAYEGCGALTTINLPDSLMALGDHAFYGTNLKTAVVPANVSLIGIGIYENCRSLAEARFLNHLTAIPARMFKGCTSLAKIEIPAETTKIGSEAFAGCISLHEIVIPPGVVDIEEDAFVNMAVDFTIVCDPESPAATYARRHTLKYTMV